MSLFSGVLGRLNGKSDAEVEKQQEAIRDAELRNYHATKFGLMNFVRGGLLVGDTIQPLAQEQIGEHSKRDQNIADLELRRKSKKQKTAVGGIEAAKSSQDLSAESSTPDDDKQKSTKKDRKRSRRDRNDNGASADLAPIDPPRSKEERRARKAERRKRKEERRLRKSSSKATSSKSSEVEEADDIEKSESGPTTPSSMAVNPRLVRRRYIDQKRMASLDPKAMKEIFMLSATA